MTSNVLPGNAHAERSPISPEEGNIRNIPSPGDTAGAGYGTSLYKGVRGTREFIEDVGGHRNRWPVLVGVGVLTVCVLGYSASNFLFEKTLSAHAPSAEEQAVTGVDKDDSLESQAGLDGAKQAIELQSMHQNPDPAEKPKKMFAFSFQAEAAAAQVRDLPVNADAAASQGDPVEAGEQNIYGQVQDLLRSASDAVRKENLELFLAHLDENESSFIRQQKLKAKIAFRQFDHIDGTYSDVKIKVLSDDELAVNLYCKVDADYAKSGRSIVLFKGEQNLTLRKVGNAVWKICAIDY